MKKNNPLKKLTLFKTTIAHLNFEQMYAVHGGDTATRIWCIDTSKDTRDCLTVGCTNSVTVDCPLTQTCV